MSEGLLNSLVSENEGDFGQEAINTLKHVLCLCAAERETRNEEKENSYAVFNWR